MDFEEYLLRMFQQTFFLLQRLTRENNAHTVKSRLQELDERYWSALYWTMMFVEYSLYSTLTISACLIFVTLKSNLQLEIAL